MNGPAMARGSEAWRGGAGLAAAAVLLVQGVWRSIYLARGYFTQDDFLMMKLSADRPLSLDLLFHDYSGHLFPGGFVIAWLHARYAPLSWPAGVVAVVGMQLAAGVLMWMVLCRLLGRLPGRRWARVPILAVYCFSPLTLWSTQWWAVAIQFLPVTICLLAAVWALLRRLQDDWAWGAPLALALTGTALLFQERGLLVPIVLAGVAVMISPVDGIRPRLVAVARSHGRLWLGFFALVAGYLLLHLRLAPITNTAADSRSDAIELVGNFVFRNAVPGVAGGPWGGEILADSTLVPPAWAVIASLIVVVVVVTYTCRRGGPTARWAWLFLAVYVVADVVLLFGGRSQLGSVFGLIPRYAADLVPVVAIALAGAVRDLPSTAGARRLPVAALAVAAAYTLAATVTTAFMAPHLFNTDDRAYVETVRAQLRDQPRVVLYDGVVPEGVMIGWFGPDGRVSTVVGTAPENPVFDVPSRQLKIVDDSGRLRDIALKSKISMRASENRECGYPVTASTTSIPMRSTVSLAKRVMRVGYYTNVTATATVRLSEQELRVPVRPGLNSVDVVVDDEFDSVQMSLSHPRATLCVAALTVGTPKPRPS